MTVTVVIFPLVISTIAAAQTPPSTIIEVFGTSTMPFKNVRDASIYYLDTVSQLESSLSEGLPPDPKQAQAIVQKRMQAMGSQLQQRAKNGAMGLARAMQIGIDRAPAIVSSGKWVIYGLTDVDQARRIFAADTARAH
jgi:integrating conjugative element protein (TIGR03757 family)